MQTNNETYTVDPQKFQSLAVDSYRHTSFYGDERGKRDTEEFAQMARELQAAGASLGQLSKFESLYRAKLSAQGRCISSFITGGSNFPVSRAEKANNVSHKRLTEFLDFYNKTLEALKKEEFYRLHPEARPVMADDDNVTARLADKIAILTATQEKMVMANKLIRSQDLDGLKTLVGDAVAAQLLKPNCFGGVGFEAFEMSNNRANIKRLEERLAAISKTKAMERREVALPDGARAVMEPEQMRVYFEFNGKPAQEVIDLLKSHGFKWTPSQKHWGRKLTPNANHSARQVIQKLKELNGKATNENI